MRKQKRIEGLIRENTISSIPRAAQGRRDISCMMKLAEALNMETVAEGVEDSELVELLKKMGCDYIQGYVFSKPMPAKDYQAFLAEFSAASVT